MKKAHLFAQQPNQSSLLNLASFCYRNTVHSVRRAQRPSVLPPLADNVHAVRRPPQPTALPPLPARKQSVSYEKITYRYITDPQPKAENQFYSLPRPARSHLRMKLPNFPQRVASPPTTTTCGRTQWSAPEIPIIVLDSCQQDSVDSVKQHLNANYLVRQETAVIPSHIYQNTCCQDIPIYENSELYGPSLTLNRQRLQRVSTPIIPLYENLAFHRQPPIARQRRRSVNTTSSYSTYKQQTGHKFPIPIPAHQNSHRRPTQRLPTHKRAQSHPIRELHETCYFV